MAKVRKSYVEIIDAQTTYIDLTTITGAGRITIAQRRGRQPAYHTTLSPAEARKLAGKLFRMADRAEVTVKETVAA